MKHTGYCITWVVGKYNESAHYEREELDNLKHAPALIAKLLSNPEVIPATIQIRLLLDFGAKE